MPLRDHFHPPLTLRHAWDELHGGWPMKIVETLGPELPAEYTAAPKVHLGGAVEIDVVTFEQLDFEMPTSGPVRSEHGATRTWTAMEPTLRVETDIPDVDEYEVRIYDLARNRRLVAAVEVVSPANKDRPDTRRAFVAKCAALLQQQVCVSIVDVVTSRNFNLYSQLLDFLGEHDASLATPPSNTYAVTCRGTLPRQRLLLEGWHRPLVVGQRLPPLPIWLDHELAITLDLEASYEAACRVLRIA